MSDRLGPMSLLPAEADGPLLPGGGETSPRMQDDVDQEVKRIVTEAQAHVTALLTAHRDQLESVAGARLHAETPDEPEAYLAAHVDRGGAGPRARRRMTRWPRRPAPTLSQPMEVTPMRALSSPALRTGAA